jgi:hypothetical protein
MSPRCLVPGIADDPQETRELFFVILWVTIGLRRVWKAAGEDTSQVTFNNKAAHFAI